MKAKVDCGLLRGAGRSVMALGAFPGGDKKENQAIACLLTAKKKALIVESAGLGVYIKHTIPASVKKDGVAAIQASKLDKVTGNGSVEISKKSNAITLQYGSTKGTIEEPAKVEKTVEDGRPKETKVVEHATVPIRLLKQALQTVSFKPGLKEESIRLQIQATKDVLEVAGVDSYSFARVRMDVSKKTGIKVDKPFQVVLRSNVLTNILKGVDDGEDEKTSVSISLRFNKKKDPVAICVKSKYLEVHYPILAVKFIHLGEQVKMFLGKHKVQASFVTKRATLLNTLGECCALHNRDAAAALKIRLRIAKKEIELTTDTVGAKSRTILVPDSVKLKGKEKIASVHEGYLTNFLAISPDEVPLRIESCGERYIRLTAEGPESMSVEYLVAKVVDRQGESSD